MRKKVIRNVVIIIVSVVVLLGIAVGVFFIAAMPRKAEPLEESSLIRWQQDLKDEILLRDVILPGSHDSGTAGMLNLMETQSHRLAQQLNYGVRYFDVRPMLSGGELYPYHAFANTSYPLKELFSEVVDFLQTNATEFVILDFQHFNNAAEQTKELLDSIDFVCTKSVPNTENLAEMTVGKMRENGYRIIVIWNTGYSDADRPYLFSRNDCLFSPYNEDAHKAGNDALISAFTEYYKDSDRTKLFVLQAQRTGSFGKEMNIAKLEDSFRPEMNRYLETLSEELLQKTNIVMRDFVTRDLETMQLIVSLNQRKNNFI